ncbi:MAG: ATP-binding cassette domain-containing protein [Candidatus Cloacimonetes bacterium]|jgi:ABC-type transport system involved in cytochrome bd biosynthesis fused ATPase/permease subunit|nr:ATP-binding cassette domain-containing protein [Candidatus Cloacimonadota bacterium]
MNSSLFQIQNITFSYPKQPPLFQDFSLDINQEDKILLTGANGSGKSTLLALLMGIVSPQEGNITLNDTPIPALTPEIYSEVLYSHQNARMDLFGLVPRNDWELWQLAIPEKFTEKSLNLADHDLMAKFDTPYAHLSGGELRAFSLLWLPLLQDKFWLLDEPTSGLDAKHKTSFVDLCQNKEKRGYLIVSYDPVMEDSLFNRILLLEKGKLIQIR